MISSFRDNRAKNAEKNVSAQLTLEWLRAWAFAAKCKRCKLFICIISTGEIQCTVCVCGKRLYATEELQVIIWAYSLSHKYTVN